MNLPHELLDEIFSYIPPDDRKSFRVYSLVARSWVSPAQRRLFSSVVITMDNYQPWKDNISPANTELLNHVRSLLYFTTGRSPSWKSLSINDFFDYLPSFRCLQHLTLCGVHIKLDISEQLEVFSAFRHTLSTLTLSALFLTWRTFTTIVNYFPDMRDLTVLHIVWELHHRQAPPLSRPLRGRLSIDMHQDQGLPIFANRLSGLDVEYDELLFLGTLDPGPSTSLHQRIVDSCRKSLKRLRLSPRSCTFRYVQDHVMRVN